MSHRDGDAMDRSFEATDFWNLIENYAGCVRVLAPVQVQDMPCTAKKVFDLQKHIHGREDHEPAGHTRRPERKAAMRRLRDALHQCRRFRTSLVVGPRMEAEAGHGVSRSAPGEGDLGPAATRGDWVKQCMKKFR